jgi:hypothetical protein
MRKYGLLLSSLIVLAIFFGGFFLFFVPANRETQNQYGFLILRTIQSDFQSKINAKGKIISNNLKNSSEQQSDVLKYNDAAWTKFLGINIEEYKPDTARKNHRIRKNSGETLTAQFEEITDDNLEFGFSSQGKEFTITSNVYDILDGITKKYANDFFQHFLLLQINDSMGTPIYLSDKLSLGDDIKINEFLPESGGGFYPGIRDISLGDIRYKLFYTPVSLNGSPYALCGFRDNQDYQHTLNQVPVKFIFPIAIVFFLLLIILPLIKLYIMDREEKINFWDFAGFAFALFIGTMFITNVIIQAVLLKDGEIKTQSQLRSLSKQIDSSFRHELINAYSQLNMIDSVGKDFNDKDFTGNLLHYITSRTYNGEKYYYNFDRVAWTDTNGKQIMKGQLDGQSPVYTPVGERNFFKDFFLNHPLRLPDSDTALFTLEPVNSLVDGYFRFIVAKRSKNPRAFITQLSTIPYSFTQVVLPPGFGFCLINNDGEVQVHSDSIRNKNENFFDEVNDSRAIKGAVTAHQELYVQNLKFYTRENATLLTPMKGLPYQLIVFYDNGYIVPVNMRILTFSLIFSLAFIFAYILFLCILFFRHHSQRPLLFTGFDYLYWLLPKSKYIHIYQVSLFYILIYMLGVLSFSFLINSFLRNNNHTLLILLFQTPVNIPLGVFIIVNALDGENNIKISRLLIILAFFHLLYILFSFGLRNEVPGALIIFDCLLILLLILININANKLKYVIEIRGLSYFSWYTLLVESIVISLSVLPSSLFSYYAYNQEILQGIKKNQLHIAVGIENRANGIYGLLHGIDSILPSGIIDSLRYGRGIFSPDTLRINLDTGFAILKNPDPVYDRFYFRIADAVSNDYYKTTYLPALKDHSRDRFRNWRISFNGDSLHLSYLLEADTGFATPRNLRLDSRIPSRYDFFKDGLNFILLVLMKIALLLALYILIRQILRGVFLRKYLHIKSSSTHGLPYFEEYVKSKGMHAGQKVDPQLTESIILHTESPNRRDLDLTEHRILENMMRWKDYYEFVMSQCEPREKRLLFNLAKTGFINYKNSVEIYHLLDDAVLVAANSRIRLFSQGFRAYLLNIYSMEADPDMSKMLKRKSSWENFKRPFMILLIGFACLIFFTQQEAWQRISALLAALTTSIPALLDMFRSGKSAK